MMTWKYFQSDGIMSSIIRLIADKNVSTQFLIGDHLFVGGISNLGTGGGNECVTREGYNRRSGNLLHWYRTAEIFYDVQCAIFYHDISGLERQKLNSAKI